MPGSNYFAFSTTYGSTFEFTCGAGNNPTGSSSETAIDRTVTCEADGYWTFGNLQCFSKCEYNQGPVIQTIAGGSPGSSVG